MTTRTLLAEMGGWTPLVDSIVHEHGLTVAAVFGRVWRYCQLPSGRCEASQPTIAKELGMGVRTVRDAVKLLCKSGYLKAESSPGRPTALTDTGKANVTLNLSSAPLRDEQGSDETPAKSAGDPGKTRRTTPAKSADDRESLRDSLDKVPPERPKSGRSRALSELEQARKRLEAAFSDAAGVSSPQELHPDGLTKAQAKAASMRWWKPLDEMYLQAGKNGDLAEECIREAVWYHRRNNLTCSCPANIQQVATSMIGDRKQEPDAYRIGSA
jgi:hypothetical protein